MENKEALLTQLFNEDIYLILKDEHLGVEESPISQVGDVHIKQDVVLQDDQAILEVVPFLGKNQRQILVLLTKQGVKICTQENLEFLGKIFTAIKLSSNDVALINIDHFVVGKHRLPEYKQIISFDVDHFLKQQSIYLPSGKYIVAPDKAVLLADSVENMQADVQLKKQFWLALQQMFL
jgi:hypothetical protein